MPTGTPLNAQASVRLQKSHHDGGLATGNKQAQGCVPVYEYYMDFHATVPLVSVLFGPISIILGID